eukprot:CAMPEP_0206453274 /NCGR_PEP_ID=MMETSP0324_2-20121206/20450_1 /ASSEMBLY_ACC=CAM_ASM_000836 /TAXON_ID=2866 /ORGANISM="Crypthecodinium cohnii, Strain Seligo" /LENGTH=114 /DNA_ID=CAMNT_0053923537 /DNA_START=70 /DNA_END=414 /DNA_ORIENTATION=-
MELAARRVQHDYWEISVSSNDVDWSTRLGRAVVLTIVCLLIDRAYHLAVLYYSQEKEAPWLDQQVRISDSGVPPSTPPTLLGRFRHSETKGKFEDNNSHQVLPLPEDLPECLEV